MAPENNFTSGFVEEILSAEQSVIGSMLIDADCIPRVLLDLSPDDFIHDSARTLFIKMAEMRRDGVPIDGVTVAGALNLNQEARRNLAGLLEATPTAANVDEYVKILKNSTQLFRLREIGQALAQSATLDDARNLLETANQIRAGKSVTKALTLEDLFQRFAARHDGEHPTAKSLIWPIMPLNDKLQAEPGNIVVLGAYPGVGKTAFALQCAAKFAEKIGEGKRIGYFLYESTPDLLYDRYVSRESGIPGQKIRKNNLSESDWAAIAAITKRLAAPIDIIPASGLTAQDITAFAIAKNYEIIFVDYIQLVAAPRGQYMREYDRVTDVSQTLQQFAARTNTIAFEISQMTRPEKSHTRAPTMSDLRSSGQIEQDADVILLMWRESYDDVDSPRILQIAKNRHGEAMGKIKLKFDGAHQEFTRMASDWRSAPTPKAKPAQKSLFEAAEDDDDMPF